MYTDCGPGEVCEDDEARCADCGATGIEQFDEDDGPWILWRTEEEEAPCRG
jgi:hypothetical protein